MDVTWNEGNKHREVLTIMKQLKNTIRAYLYAIMLAVYIIGVVTVSNGAPHTWQRVLIIMTGIGIVAVNLYLLE